MPKGRHKGARRQFTNFDAETERKEKEEKEAAWRARRGELPSDDSDEEGSGKEKEKDEESSEEEEESSEEESSDGEEKVKKNKGVEGLIELENPNRTGVKSNRKVTALDGAPAEKPQLSRREREEIEKERAALNYRKLHSAGKTDEARADLERLALVRARREAAEQKKREQAQAAKEAAEAKAPTKKKT